MPFVGQLPHEFAVALGEGSTGFHRGPPGSIGVHRPPVQGFDSDIGEWHQPGELRGDLPSTEGHLYVWGNPQINRSHECGGASKVLLVASVCGYPHGAADIPILPTNYQCYMLYCNHLYMEILILITCRVSILSTILVHMI